MQHSSRNGLLTTAVLGGCLAFGLAGPVAADTSLEVENDGLVLSAFVSSSKDVLSTNIRVVGPDGFVFEDRIEDSSIQWIPEGDLADGIYRWQVRTVTVEKGAPTRQLILPQSAAAVNQTNTGGVDADSVNGQGSSKESIDKGIDIPVERYFESADKSVHSESGLFRVQDGLLIPIEDGESSVSRNDPNILERAIGAVLDFVFPSAQAQQVFTTDIEIETLAPGLNLDNTGTAANLWRIWVGAGSGDLYFRDSTNANTTPLRIEQGAPENSIRINAAGNIGIGDAVPTEDLHISSTNPRIRLQDDGAFQSWYVKNSNAGQFEIGESANSGAFVIKPGAALSSITIDGSGRVGIGTNTPAQPLHVAGNNVRIEHTSSTWDLNPGSQGLWFNLASPSTKFGVLKLQNDAPVDSIVAAAGGVGFGTDSPSAPIHVSRNDDTFEMITLDQVNNSVVQDRNMMQLNNNGGIRFQFDNNALATQWRFQAATGNQDVFEIAKVGTGAIELELDAGGNLTIAGALTQQSDVNSKRDIESVVVESVLEKLDRIRVSEWTYKTDEDGVRHLGPMAQDFHSVFSLGDDNTKIAPADMAGVALAAIQAQQRIIREQQMELDKLRSELEGVEKLEARMGQLEARLPPQMVDMN